MHRTWTTTGDNRTRMGSIYSFTPGGDYLITILHLQDASVSDLPVFQLLHGVNYPLPGQREFLNCWLDVMLRSKLQHSVE